MIRLIAALLLSSNESSNEASNELNNQQSHSKDIIFSALWRVQQPTTANIAQQWQFQFSHQVSVEI